MSTPIIGREGLLRLVEQAERLHPVTVPSHVQMSSSLAPQYQREWDGQ